MSTLQRTLLGTASRPSIPTRGIERIELDDASWIDVSREWLLGADTLLDALVDTVDWKQGRRHMYDRVLDDPRLSRWYAGGDALPHPALDVDSAARSKRSSTCRSRPSVSTTTATATTASPGTPTASCASSSTRASRS